MLKLLIILIFTSYIFASIIKDNPLKNSLIIYNDNIGLVYEKHSLKIKKNDLKITYPNVSTSIKTNSINVKLPKSITVYSQQYKINKLTQKELLQNHINKEILVKEMKAKLLSFSNSESLVQTSTNKIITVQNKNIIFNNISDNFITKPSLIWNIKADKKLNTTMDINYLIQNINFKSNYILDINSDKANLTGWIIINNHSGKKFKNTQLSILAGNINLIKERNIIQKNIRMMSSSDNATEVKHKNHEGYHIYKIPNKVELSNNEITQIKFLTKENIYIEKKYESTMSYPRYLNSERKHTVIQYIDIKNLNIPIPNGTVNIYSKLDNNTIFLGQDKIDNTSKNRPIKIKIGINFNISVIEQIIKKDNNKKYFNSTINYTVKNDSNKDKIIEVLVPFNRNKNSIINTEQDYKLTKSNLISFNIFVKANSLKSFIVNYKNKKDTYYRGN
ncbi:MAG: hypothetical protein U9N02_04280 [Campylobacterota bacterium]|nr:hypothetical protein [Campylobacterota bacterium]